jgi:hypothetical protein
MKRGRELKGMPETHPGLFAPSFVADNLKDFI